MPPIKFTSILDPNKINPGDKITLKGIIEDNAKEFSINFVNSTCGEPSNITYHFKWLINEQQLVEDYKEHGQWRDHIRHDYDKPDGVLIINTKFKRHTSNEQNNNDNDDDDAAINSYNNDTNNIILSNSDYILDNMFHLEFAFQTDTISVYKIYDGGANLLTTYEPSLDIEDIKSIQIWGNVKKVKELSFNYAS